MNVTLEESVAIYARASQKWFGAAADRKTRERVAELARAGDLEGVRVHQRVREHITRLERPSRGDHRRHG